MASGMDGGTDTSTGAIGGYVEGTVFACKKCRKVLFGLEALTTHEPSRQSFSFRKTKGKRPVMSCDSLFLESTLPWMDKTASDVESKLLCPHCNNRLGSLKWAGSQCSCGSWITPAIQFPKARLDVCPPRQSLASMGSVVSYPVVIRPRAEAGVGGVSAVSTSGTGVDAGADALPATIASAAPAAGSEHRHLADASAAEPPRPSPGGAEGDGAGGGASAGGSAGAGASETTTDADSPKASKTSAPHGSDEAGVERSGTDGASGRAV